MKRDKNLNYNELDSMLIVNVSKCNYYFYITGIYNTLYNIYFTKKYKNFLNKNLKFLTKLLNLQLLHVTNTKYVDIK